MHSIQVACVWFLSIMQTLLEPRRCWRTRSGSFVHVPLHSTWHGLQPTVRLKATIPRTQSCVSLSMSATPNSNVISLTFSVKEGTICHEKTSKNKQNEGTATVWNFKIYIGDSQEHRKFFQKLFKNVEICRQWIVTAVLLNPSSATSQLCDEQGYLPSWALISSFVKLE